MEWLHGRHSRHLLAGSYRDFLLDPPLCDVFLWGCWNAYERNVCPCSGEWSVLRRTGCVAISYRRSRWANVRLLFRTGAPYWWSPNGRHSIAKHIFLQRTIVDENCCLYYLPFPASDTVHTVSLCHRPDGEILFRRMSLIDVIGVFRCTPYMKHTPHVHWHQAAGLCVSTTWWHAWFMAGNILLCTGTCRMPVRIFVVPSSESFVWFDIPFSFWLGWVVLCYQIRQASTIPNH